MPCAQTTDHFFADFRSVFCYEPIDTAERALVVKLEYLFLQHYHSMIAPICNSTSFFRTSPGIGYETAKQLAFMGAKVIMACRDEARAMDVSMVDIWRSDITRHCIQHDISRYRTFLRHSTLTRHPADHPWGQYLGAVSIYTHRPTGIGIPIIKRRFYDLLIFIMEITIPGNRVVILRRDLGCHLWGSLDTYDRGISRVSLKHHPVQHDVAYNPETSNMEPCQTLYLQNSFWRKIAML